MPKTIGYNRSATRDGKTGQENGDGKTGTRQLSAAHKAGRENGDTAVVAKTVGAGEPTPVPKNWHAAARAASSGGGGTNANDPQSRHAYLGLGGQIGFWDDEEKNTGRAHGALVGTFMETVHRFPRLPPGDGGPTEAAWSRRSPYGR